MERDNRHTKNFFSVRDKKCFQYFASLLVHFSTEKIVLHVMQDKMLDEAVFSNIQIMAKGTKSGDCRKSPVNVEVW